MYFIYIVAYMYSVGPPLRNPHVKKSTLRDPASEAKKIPSPERGEPAVGPPLDLTSHETSPTDRYVPVGVILEER